MAFKVGIGKSDFEDMRKSDNYYVDKTDIMYELVEETDNKVTLFTRPRRFGKTLMMSYSRGLRLPNINPSVRSGRTGILCFLYHLRMLRLKISMMHLVC